MIKPTENKISYSNILSTNGFINKIRDILNFLDSIQV